MYVSIIMDRENNGPVFVVSQKVSFHLNFCFLVISYSFQGGMDIEAVAHDDPSAIVTLPIDIRTGPTDENLDFLARKLGFSKELHDQVCESSIIGIAFFFNSF